jgi:hypothetical protein
MTANRLQRQLHWRPNWPSLLDIVVSSLDLELMWKLTLDEVADACSFCGYIWRAIFTPLTKLHIWAKERLIWPDQVSTWQTALFCIWWFIYTHMWEENLALPNLQNIHKLAIQKYTCNLTPESQGRLILSASQCILVFLWQIRVKGYYIHSQNSCNCHVIGPKMS